MKRFKPLTLKQIEVYVIAGWALMFVLLGAETSRDPWIFNQLPASHVQAWSDYLPGTWEAVDSRGNRTQMTFPDCALLDLAPDDVAAVRAGTLPTPVPIMLELGPSQSSSAEIQEDLQGVIVARQINAFRDPPDEVEVIFRGNENPKQIVSRLRTWDVELADATHALVSTPSSSRQVDISGPPRDHIYLEKVDDQTIRATSERRIREGRYDVLTYERTGPPPHVESGLSFNVCYARY